MLFTRLFFRLEPYADPYYDYEIERFWRGGQYENFRVQYTETEPYHNYRVSVTAALASRWSSPRDYPLFRPSDRMWF